MGKLIGLLLKNNNAQWLTQILAGAGLGLVTATGLSVFADYYIQKAIAGLSTLGNLAGIAGLFGLDTAISMIIGAYLASIYISTFAAGLRLVKK